MHFRWVFDFFSVVCFLRCYYEYFIFMFYFCFSLRGAFVFEILCILGVSLDCFWSMVFLGVFL